MRLLLLKVVLAAIDLDDASAMVLDAARALVDASGATLHVVHVVHVAPVDRSPAVSAPPSNESEGTSIDAALALLARANVQLDRDRLHVIAGDPSETVRALADRIRADVIVLGRHRGRSHEPRRLASTALAVATSSWAPCLIVARSMRLPLKRVIVPLDLSDTARGALVVALSWSSALRGKRDAPGEPAALERTRLTALHVSRTHPAARAQLAAPQALRDELDRVRQKAGTWAGVDIEGVTIASGDVAATIAEYARAEDADLVVLGTRGLGLDAVGRLGSVSHAVSRELETPILLVPPAVWTQAREE